MRLRRLMAASMAGVMAVSSVAVCQITANAYETPSSFTMSTCEPNVIIGTNYDGTSYEITSVPGAAGSTSLTAQLTMISDAYGWSNGQIGTNSSAEGEWVSSSYAASSAGGTYAAGDTITVDLATYVAEDGSTYLKFEEYGGGAVRIDKITYSNGYEYIPTGNRIALINSSTALEVTKVVGAVGSTSLTATLLMHDDAYGWSNGQIGTNSSAEGEWVSSSYAASSAGGTYAAGDTITVDLATYVAEDGSTYLKFEEYGGGSISVVSIKYSNGYELDVNALKEVAVTGVELNKTTLALTAGDSETLTATVTPEDATDPTVTWTSSDPTVATVKDGVVTAVKAGTATITAAAGDKTATCAVTVTPATYTVTVGATTNGTVTADTAETTAGTKVQLTVTPAADYELDTLTVKNGTKAVTVAADNSFTMPAGNVTVAATFKAVPHNITTSSSNGTITVAKTAVKGKAVTITPVPASGYELDTLTVTGKTSGKAVTVTNNAFTMPAEDVVIKATFKKSAATIVAEAAAKVTENMDNIVADNDTTDQDVLDAINECINNTAVTSSWDTKNPFNKKVSTTEAAGSITGTVNLQSSGVTTGVAVKIEIAKIPVTAADKVAAAKKNAQKALNSITATNTITSDTILAAVNKNISGTGVTAAISGFKVTKATSSAAGSVTGTITLTSGDVSDTLAINLTIAMTEKTDAEKLAEAKAAAQKIFTAAKSAADITEAKIVAAINNTEVAVVFNTTTVDSTTTTEGSTTVTAALSVGTESTTVTRSFTIPKKDFVPKTDAEKLAEAKAAAQKIFTAAKSAADITEAKIVAAINNTEVAVVFNTTTVDSTTTTEGSTTVTAALSVGTESTTVTRSFTIPKKDFVPKNEIKVLFTGTTALGTDWSKSVTVPKADVKVGDTIRIKVGIGSADYHQVKIMNSDWKELTSPEGVNEWGCVDVSEDGYVTFVLNEADAKAISEGGLIISGYDTTITGVDAVLLKDDATIKPTVAASTGSTKVDSVIVKQDSNGKITEEIAVFAISAEDAENCDFFQVTITREKDSAVFTTYVDKCYKYVTFNYNGADVRVTSSGAYTVALDITGIGSDYGTLTIKIAPGVAKG